MQEGLKAPVKSLWATPNLAFNGLNRWLWRKCQHAHRAVLPPDVGNLRVAIALVPWI